MFYGINSRERDRAGFIADKNRYAPWAGTSMAGRIDCLANGEELTILRATRRQSSPMGEFKAVYTGTGEPVSTLSSQNCGETLLGVSREVFERSAFIRQAGLAISQDAGLERRIASLITTGEENTSYTEAADVLKKQLNRRRHNRTGQIPALEAELAENRRQLDEIRSLERQLTAASAQAEALAASELRLTEELARHDRWDALQRQQSLEKLEKAAEEAEARADALRRQLETDHIPGNDTIARLRGAIVNLETVRKSVSKARDERDEAMKSLLRAEAAVGESPFAGETAESAWKSAAAVTSSKSWSLSELLPSLFLGAFALVLSITGILNQDMRFVICGILCAAFALIIPFYKHRGWKKRTSELLKRHRVSSVSELREAAAAYSELLNARDAAQSALDKRSAAADTLYNSLSSNEQGILLEVRRFAPAAYDISTADSLLRGCAARRKELTEAEAAAKEARMRCELQGQQSSLTISDSKTISPPTRTRADLTAQLKDVQSALAGARSTADRLSGQLHAIGDPAVLASSAQLLMEQKTQLETEYHAIRLAMEALSSANTALQNRFSPALGRRAAEIFSQLTDGRYSGVVLDRSFHLSAEPAGDTIYRDAQLLSAGAADQLYLAVRLAICDLVLPEENAVPIILDDALANFDDVRCAAALRWLKEESRRRQILLFTCHSREADFFAGDSEVFIQQLTEAVPQV